jgi:hypothetical protein
MHDYTWQGGDTAHQSWKARYPAQGSLQHGCQERKLFLPIYKNRTTNKFLYVLNITI